MQTQIPRYSAIKKVENDLELYIYLIRVHCIIENIYLSYRHTVLLAYYIKFGISRDTEELFKKEMKVDRQQQVANLKKSLKEKGLIYKAKDEYQIRMISPSLSLKLDQNLAIILKIEIDD